MTATTKFGIDSRSLADVAFQCYHENCGMTVHEWLTFIWRNRDDIFVAPGIRGLLIATLVDPNTAHVKAFYGDAKLAVTLIRLFQASHPDLVYMTYKCVGRDRKRNRVPHMRRVSLSRFSQLINLH